MGSKPKTVRRDDKFEFFWNFQFFFSNFQIQKFETPGQFELTTDSLGEAL